MRSLNNMELQCISGGDLDKPLLQSSFSDVATYFGIWTGFKEGMEAGKGFYSFSAGGFNVGSIAGTLVGGVLGAALGGLIAGAAVHYVIPKVTSLAD